MRRKRRNKRRNNCSEKQFVSFAASHRFKVLRNGWPDFFVQDSCTGEFFGVEAKKGETPISVEQQAMFAALEAFGCKVVVWNPSRPQELIPWRTYLPDRGISLRIRRVERAVLSKMAKNRGGTHTTESVAAEMISRGLQKEIVALADKARS